MGRECVHEYLMYRAGISRPEDHEVRMSFLLIGALQPDFFMVMAATHEALFFLVLFE